MKKLSVISLCLLVCLGVHHSLAGEFNESSKYTGTYLLPSAAAELAAQYFQSSHYLTDLTSQDSLTREQQLAQLPGYKLPKRALFFSALIPGAGEMYVGSYLKAAAFFMVEVSAWTFYAVYNQKGKDKEKEFQQFADENWDPMAWLAWYESAPKELRDRFTHASHMAELIDQNKKTQQYYEMIGKYSEFVVGWQGVPRDLDYDFDKIVDYRKNNCQIADDYMKQRAKSNDLFAQARTGTTIAMLNHLLSAIDAAWTAKQHNNRLVKTSLRFEQIEYANQPQPVLSLKIQW
ncbi:MAG: hypothetical protein ONB16_07815 [candidate division KSB1 bacterium]|nr:hypothetical protein [candidate division KSB1 bacterium]MDZ7319782.1 hypothetical protein [candidate division KSB1 bacterium]MDZ7339929.1 hypothetical protein [candidate division KSB1 bacterium]